MKFKGLFVTGIDTGVGKTLVSCVLAKVLSQRFQLGVMKPFASGNRLDIQRLKRACGRKDLDFDTLNPIFFNQPLSPFSASLSDQKKIDLSKILKSYRWLQKHSDFVIVEGIGGLHVPLREKFTVADLALKMNLPLVIVAHPFLGTLNHTFLTVDYARHKGLKIQGIIVNVLKDHVRDPSFKSNPFVLSRLARLPILATLPYLKGKFNEKVKKAVQMDLLNCDWVKSL
jgi:dethiobiotin synthetase